MTQFTNKSFSKYSVRCHGCEQRDIWLDKANKENELLKKDANPDAIYNKGIFTGWAVVIEMIERKDYTSLDSLAEALRKRIQ